MKHTIKTVVEEEVDVTDENIFDYLFDAVMSHPRMRDGVPHEPSYEVLKSLAVLSNRAPTTRKVLEEFGLKLVITR